MGKKYRSARGDIVDIDLLKIKQQIANAPKPTTVQEREQFVDKRIRRRVKKQVVNDDGLDLALEVKQSLLEQEFVAPEPTPVEEVEATNDTAHARPIRRKKEK